MRWPAGAAGCTPPGVRVVPGGGPVGYGPSLQALAVYLLVAQFLPVGRVVALLESLTGAGLSAGFVHGMLACAAGLLDVADKRIRALLTLADVVSAAVAPLAWVPLGFPGRYGAVAGQPGCGSGSGRWRIVSMAVASGCDQGQWRGRRSHLRRCPWVSLAGTVSSR